ncbi:MAG: class I SAM-dependent methyltransferase [Anaerolineales bacterium]|jgi:ubiquinone/menaquinone biosynthesis C-methylase UbiE
MPIFDHFDFLAPIYDRVIRAPGETPLFKLLDPPPPGWLLDAGGGTGRVAAALSERFEKVVIADGSLPMLGQAQAKGCCAAVVGYTERLPFSDGAFERVIVVDAYHHLADQRASLHELWRVLAPGGRLVIEEPDIDRFGVKLVALAERLALMRSRFVRAESIADALEQLGAQTRITRQEHNAWVVGEKH